jgi:hypothetical protein
MVAPLIAAAGISAASSLVSGITGGKGAKKAAKIQAQTARDQIAAIERNRQQILGLSQPTIDRGNSAATIYAGMLGAGGDPTASKAALDTWRGSVGYQDLVDQGLGAVNANAYARGMGGSGATLKALQRTGANIANQSAQQYMGNLGNLIAAGNSAIGNVAGVNTSATNAINGINQNTADAQGNAALAQSGAMQNGLQNLVNLGGAYAGMKSVPTFSSSYGQGSTGGTVKALNPWASQVISQNPGIF